METQYTAPELKLVGSAEAVVFGSLATGVDLGDQFLSSDSEFEADQEPPATQR